MADTFNKKEREKKKERKRKEKAERKLNKKNEGKKEVEFMYVDSEGNFTSEKPDISQKRQVRLEEIEIGIPKKEKIEVETTRTGSVKFFDVGKGYGFISETSTNESFFVHANNLVDEITDADKVTFEVEKGPKGPIAVNVRLTP